jgi:hypothetical protein
MTALLIAIAAAAAFLFIVDAQDRAARRRASQKRHGRTHPAAWDEPSRLDRLERDGLGTFRRDDGAR